MGFPEFLGFSDVGVKRNGVPGHPCFPSRLTHCRLALRRSWHYQTPCFGAVHFHRFVALRLSIRRFHRLISRHRRFTFALCWRWWNVRPIVGLPLKLCPLLFSRKPSKAFGTISRSTLCAAPLSCLSCVRRNRTPFYPSIAATVDFRSVRG